ncbi:threonyl-tRNA synthetase [Artemisia annua]|uniref:Threonyl-tRNA synthetase n=1 Tax=Artemisia annua TaxID=35608 RepID=A0A2U1LZG0_ARTAN|nr:threonyl-tRNA synthetase [Artemisia annua]
MASSATHHPLFTSSLKLPSTTNPISKHYLLNPKKLQSFYLFKKPHFHRFSAVATDPSTAVDKNLAEDAPPVEKVVLPTNESSNKLLRIRHTVISIPFCYFWFL